MNAFNPNDHLMQIKNRNGSSDYLPVAWRLVWFREHCPDGEIVTEAVMIDLDKETAEETYAWNNETRRSEKVTKRANGIAIFRATVKDGKGGIATGTKCEKAASFDDFIEKAETGSIGRALAALGYGTQFAPDMEEGQRIVDSPIEPKPTTLPTQPRQSDEPVVENLKQVISSCHNRAYKLGLFKTVGDYERYCQRLIGKPAPETLADVNRLNQDMATHEKKAS